VVWSWYIVGEEMIMKTTKVFKLDTVEDVKVLCDALAGLKEKSPVSLEVTVAVVVERKPVTVFPLETEERYYARAGEALADLDKRIGSYVVRMKKPPERRKVTACKRPVRRDKGTRGTKPVRRARPVER
jgi:hypothetical protein